MRHITFACLLILFIPILLAQDEDGVKSFGKESVDHLWPVDAGYGLFFKGAEKITQKNMPMEHEYVELEAMFYLYGEMPKTVTVFSNYKTNLHRLALAYVSKEITDEIRTTDVKIKSKSLDSGLVRDLNYIFEEVLIETRYSQYNKGLNFIHWSTYQFYVEGGKYGSMFGETWSPHEGTLPRFLVDVSELLFDYVNEKISSDELEKGVKQLKTQIEVKKAYR